MGYIPHYAFWVFMVNAVLVLATLAIAIFAAIQARAAKASADAFVKAERAYVMVDIGKIPDFQPDPNKVDILWVFPTLHNRGRTIARITKIVARAHQIAVLDGLPPEPEYPLSKSVVLERDIWLAGDVAFQPVQFPVAGFDLITIRERKSFLYIYGCIDYIDIGETERKTNFCFIYWVQAGFNPNPDGFYVSTSAPRAYTRCT